MAALFVAAPAAGQVGDIEIGGGNPFLMKKASDHVNRVKSALKQVLARVEEARNEKDIVKLNCVSEKLAQLKQILSVAEGAEVALQEAVAKSDPGSDAEYSKIAIARGKADQLRTEAEECVGQLAFVVDEKTAVEVQQPEDLPPESKGTSSVDSTTPVRAAELADAVFGARASSPPVPVGRPRAASVYMWFP